MSLEDIQIVEAVALATERAYNSQKLKEELDFLFSESKINPFELMRDLGFQIQKLAHPYTNKSFYLAIYEGLRAHLSETQSKTIVNHAYIKNSALWPPVLFSYTIDKSRLNRIREKLAIDQNIKHAILLDRLDGRPGHEFWIFGTKEKKQCFILDDTDGLEKEEIL